MPQKKTISRTELPLETALNWAASQSPVCFLTGNGVSENGFPTLLAIGAKSEVKADSNAFAELKAWLKTNEKTWKFGYFSYDLKNELENLQSRHNDAIEFPALHFFVPAHLLIFHLETIDIYSAIDVLSEIAAFKQKQTPKNEAANYSKNITLAPQLSKADYIKIIHTIKNHILEGDLYEMNFCQAFSAENVHLNPMATFQKLNKHTNSPFAAYYSVDKRHLLCASPERFLKKTGNTLISQPIKGTIRRGKTAEEDAILKQQLQASEKDRAENVMIVDLVRNDLARSCEVGSVCVPELCEIYSFAQVHQLISTVQGRLRDDVFWLDALCAAFPMGSMTGAPKVMSMQLIEAYEQTKRGLYSGAVGYISPDDDFDFNVVIRSLFYHEKNRYLSAEVGGAIVHDSEAESEYEECLLKLKAIKAVLADL